MISVHKQTYVPYFLGLVHPVTFKLHGVVLVAWITEQNLTLVEGLLGYMYATKIPCIAPTTVMNTANSQRRHTVYLVYN
jgi:hypothetical protein